MDFRNIKNIVFDFGGILVNLNKPRCLKAFEEMGFPQAARLVDAYSQQGIFGLLETGDITPEEFCNKARALAGKDFTDEELWNAWNLFLVDIPTWKLETLLALRKNYPLYLLSNTNIPHWQYACEHLFPHRGFCVNDYFDRIFLSYELHQAKPAPDIFRTMTERTGLVPEETLFIDDSAANCATARSLGFQAHCPSDGEEWRKLFPHLTL